MSDQPRFIGSAPKSVAYCLRCGQEMHTRQVAGKPRRVCATCGYIHFLDPKVSVGTFVMQEKKILLVRRMMRPAIGKWSLPAGYLDQGEAPKQTAVRETYEETGLHVMIDHLIDVYHNPPEAGGATVFILYHAHVVGGQLRAGDDADAANFFALDALPDIAFDSTKDVIQQLHRRK